MPRFSMIIPTKSRAELLPWAIESAVTQHGDDFEVVVSDNHSDDDTANILERFAAQGVKVVRPPAPLTMPDHWDFAVTQATGDWILLLADDDAFCPNLLDSLRSAIRTSSSQVISWLSARYMHPVPSDASVVARPGFGRLDYYAEQSNTLLMPSNTGEAIELDARARLELLFAFENDPTVPRGYTSAMTRDVADDGRRRAGRLFVPLSPDYSFPAVILSGVERYSFIDAPLQIFGAYPRSGEGSLVERFISAFAETDPLHRLPLPSPKLVTNLIAETLLRAKDHLAHDLDGIDVSWERYFAECWGELLWMRHHDIDTRELQAQFFAALDRQPSAVRDAVRSSFSVRHSRLADAVRNAKRSALASVVRKVLYRVDRRSSLDALVSRRDLRRFVSEIAGDKAGFSDILGAAAYAASHHAPRAIEAAGIAHHREAY